MLLSHQPTRKPEPNNSLLFKNYFGSPVDSGSVVTNELIHQALSLYCTIIDEKNSAFPYSKYKKRLDNLARRALKRYKRRIKNYSSELGTCMK
jgi:uncharacterized protein with ATP-grasp and redox domains